MENQSMLQKVKDFIIYCGCISEFDKYFWMTRITKFDDAMLARIYEVLLNSEKELVQVELQSVGRIKALIDASYPELAEAYLPNYSEIFKEFKRIEEDASATEIHNLRQSLNKTIISSK